MSIASRDPNILVIEDNPADVAMLRLAFEEAGLDCNITVLEDGGEALAFLQLHRTGDQAPKIDLAILDLNLPKHGGLEILQALRANTDLANTLVAVLSSSSSARERSQLAELSVEAFITKPPDLDEFMKIGQLIKEILQTQ